MWCRVHTDPASCCTHHCLQASMAHHPLSPELTVDLRSLSVPGRGFGAFLEWLSRGSCKAVSQCVRVLSQHSFSGLLEHSKAKTSGDVQYLPALSTFARPRGATVLSHMGLGWRQGTGEPVWVAGMCWRCAGWEHGTGTGIIQCWKAKAGSCLPRASSRVWD